MSSSENKVIIIIIIIMLGLRQAGNNISDYKCKQNKCIYLWPPGTTVSSHRDPRCSYTALRGVHCRGQLNVGDHPKYRQKTPIAVVIFSEHVMVNRGDGCSNEGCALAVLYLFIPLCWLSTIFCQAYTVVEYFLCITCPSLINIC